jgi:NAD(P)-dependent dehydrogenase (short-subunit alcohol dehydrogenase family)
MEFSGKVVLVTGASRGIGRAIAQAFALEGARVALHYAHHLQLAQEVLRSLKGSGHMLFQADLARRDTAARLVPEVIAAMGGLNVLVNNAGIFELHPVPETEPDRWAEIWEQTVEVNLRAPALLSFAAAREMMRQGGGSIINIGSRGAFRGEPTAPAYGASKAGLHALSQSLANALAPHGIYVHAIAPGWVETDMGLPYLQGPEGESVRRQSPLRRVGQPEEIARIALFLASPRSAYLTGCIIDANGASYLRS